MYLLDTNIFLEILLDQKESSICLKVLELLDANSPGFISHFSLHAIEAITGRSGRFTLLSKFLQSLNQNPFLDCLTTTIDEDIEITRLAPRVGLDFDDTMQYYLARKRNLTLVSLDRDFVKIKDINVKSPRQMV